MARKTPGSAAALEPPVSDRATGGLLVNVGCGSSPIRGWLNLDNSLSVLLAPMLPVWLLPQQNQAVVKSARALGVRYATATRLPLPDNSAALVYSSHMIEHLDQQDGEAFIAEAFRVLQPGGSIRIVAPDLKRLIDQYVAGSDADRFMQGSLLSYVSPRTVREKMLDLLVGFREHRWLYDARSLIRLLVKAGFIRAVELEGGATTIQHPSGLDLFERPEDSFYVEAVKPA